jgi:hypothetical protein
MIEYRSLLNNEETSDAIWSCILKNQVLVIRQPAKDVCLTLDALEKNASKETVWVEKLSVDDANRSGSFGLGVRFSTSFGEFTKMLRNRDTGEFVYLSTQPIDDDSKTGLPSHLVAPPLSTSLSLFELRPRITEKLVPANINVWIGSSRSGASSGLHHDFHANLYTLLRGRKRFTVAAPSSYKAMYLYGKVLKLHPNGLINYEGAETLEDGRPIAEEVEEDEEDAAEVDAMWTAISNASFTRLNVSATTSATSISRKRARPSLMMLKKEEEKPSLKDGSKKTTHPNHFSRIPLAELRKKVRNASSSPLSPDEVLSRIQKLPEVKTNFPLFSSATLYTFELSAGDCLFLPQGWFHEVESLGDEKGDDDIHMALNHWFWPPISEKSGSTRSSPYGKEAGAFFESAFKRATKNTQRKKQR